MNIVVCGNTGTGKSSAIRRVLQQTNEPLYGFWTEKLAPNLDGRCPVFIHGCREPLTYASDHCIGMCRERCAEKFPLTFETVGVPFLTDIPEHALVLMDEIGVMENDAKGFCAEIFRTLDGNYRVLVAVRDRATPLLDAIRAHEKSRCFSAAETRSEDFLKIAQQELHI